MPACFIDLHYIKLAVGQELSTSVNEYLGQYIDRVNFKEYLPHQGKGLPASVIKNAYVAEKEKAMLSFKAVDYMKVRKNAIMVGKYVL